MLPYHNFYPIEQNRAIRDFEDWNTSNKPEDRMVNYLLALLLITLQAVAAQAQAQRQPSKKQPLNAERIAAAILPSVVLIESEKQSTWPEIRKALKEPFQTE